MKTKTVAIMCLIAAALVASGQALPKQRSPTNLTGHYRFRKGEFRNHLSVLQLSGGRIKFNLTALWVSPNNPENIHNGEIAGVVAVSSGTAIYENGDCKISMQFSRTGVVVREDHAGDDCGFGVNVSAAGVYRKIDSKKPRFQ